MTSTLCSAFETKMEEAFDRENLPQRLAAAVSGGSDSLALCLLTSEWCRRNSISLIAMTVDHGLRPEAAIEAEKVRTWLAEQGIEHLTLKWDGPYPKTGIQKAARLARYELLLQECDRYNIDTLLIGHQLEDQLETLLMRLSKGSGLQGLSAMSLVTKRDGKRLIRPLLDIPRQDLRVYLKECSQPWFDDPSNENPVYTRTKLGSVLKSVVALPGSDLQSVALASRRLQRAEAALDYITSEHIASQAVISPYGFVTIPAQFYKTMPLEVALRFLSRIFTFVRGAGEKPALLALEKLLIDIQGDDQLSARTLAGCQLKRFKENWIICREAGRKGLPALVFTGLSTTCWDNRFIIVDHEEKCVDDEKSDLEVRIIGDEGWQFLKKTGQLDTKLSLPGVVRKNLPAIWKKEQLVAAPLFSYEIERMGIAQGRFEMVFSPKCGLI